MSRSIPQWIKDSKYHFCAVCGRTDDLQYHHWTPVELGGETIPENIIVLCAEHHQQFHGQRGKIKHNSLISEGIKRAKERGVKLGRPRRNDYEGIMRLIAENSTQFNADSLVTEHEIMEMAGIKEVCYAKCKRMLFDAMAKDEWPYEWAKPVQVRKHPMYDRMVKRLRGAGA